MIPPSLAGASYTRTLAAHKAEQGYQTGAEQGNASRFWNGRCFVAPKPTAQADSACQWALAAGGDRVRIHGHRAGLSQGSTAVYGCPGIQSDAGNSENISIESRCRAKRCRTADEPKQAIVR